MSLRLGLPVRLNIIDEPIKYQALLLIWIASRDLEFTKLDLWDGLQKFSKSHAFSYALQNFEEFVQMTHFASAKWVVGKIKKNLLNFPTQNESFIKL